MTPAEIAVRTKQLRADFDTVMAHRRYSLSPEARKVAWDSAMTHIIHAGNCYAAIARSLK